MLGSVRRALRELFGIVPTLDLHRFGVRDALDATERFLRDARADGTTAVRIVYGKGRGSPGGRGVLREVIPQWLEANSAGLVERFERLPDASGADGAVKVWLTRRVTVE